MRSFLSAPAQRPEVSADTLIRRFESETAEILEAPQPIQARATLFVLAGCLAALIAVTVFMRIDRIVTSSSGQIVTTAPTTVLQALDPSIIKSIEVQEGDRVKGGQLLATLDPTFAAADVSALKLQIASLDAQIARAEAELAHRPFSMPESGEPGAAAYAALQKSYFDQRQGQFAAQMHAYDEQIAQTRTTIAKYQNDQTRFADRAKVSEEVEAMRATLAHDQTGSRLNLLAATDQRLEILRNLELDHNLLVENEHQLESVLANRDAFVQQWLGQVSQELVTAQNARDNAREQLAKASKHRDLVRLEAPEDAVVLRLAKLSVGSVLREADPFINLAPLGSPVEAEVHIEARDIGFIRPGDEATIKLAAFNFVEHGTAQGKVRWISEGAFTVDDDGKPVDPFYKARIALSRVELDNVPDSFRLVPGMTLAADIHVGTRSAFAYLVRGLVSGIGEAMREP